MTASTTAFTDLPVIPQPSTHSTLRAALRVGASLVLALTTACGSGDSTGPSPEGTIRLTIATRSLVPGQQTTVVATAVSAEGVDQPDVPVTLASSSTTIVQLAGAGLLTAGSPGSANITATADGYASTSLSVGVDDGAWLSSAGGSYSGLAGRLRLDVPAGAVASPQAIRFLADTPNEPSPWMVMQSMVQVGFESDLFSAPVTLSLFFDPAGGPAGLPLEALGIRRYFAGSWGDEEGSVVDVVANSVTTDITQGGRYAVGRLIPNTPCVDPAARALDFWIGEWNVLVGTNLVATSSITLEPGGCAIYEAYNQGNGLRGRSISFYEPTTDRWYQTYLDTTGWRIWISGDSWASGILSMQTPGATNYELWTWTLLGNGDVTQVARQTSDGGATFAPPGWNARYVPRP